MRTAIVVLLVLDLVIVLLAWPMIAGWVKPNVWFGFRSSRALADVKIWYESNRIAGKALAIVGTGHGIYCILQLLGVFELSPSLSAALLTGSVAVGGLYAKRRAEAVESRSE